MVAVVGKILELAGLMRAEAEAIGSYNHGAADGLRRWADRFESAVQAEAPEWVSIREVRAWKGWSDKHLRSLARKAAGNGEARMTNRGWEFLYTYAQGIPVNPIHLRAIRSEEDAEEFGRQMGERE